MKSASGSLFGNLLTPLTLREPSGQRPHAPERHAGSFTAHMHSAETKRQQPRQSPRAKADVQAGSAKEVRSSANGSSPNGVKHAKPTDPSKPARPSGFAPKINAQRNPQPETESASATAIPDSAGSAAPIKAEEEAALPNSEMQQTTPPNQVMLVTSLVMSAPPVIQPTNPVTATGEGTLVTAGSLEQPIETLRTDSMKCEAAEEKNVSASALEPAEQIKPEQQRETLTGDPGGSSKGESQKDSRDDKPRLGALTALPADSAERVNGTATAKQMLPMINTLELEESAGPAVKNLPGAERGLEEPVTRAISRVAEGREAQVEAALASFSATSLTNRVAATTNITSTSDVPTVERVVHAVMEGVVHMRHTGTDSVTVVLKPDGGTELFLRVEMRDGTLSAQLHFERGDREAFDQHFDELQRRLAEQGVRLSRTEDAGMGGNAQFAQSQRRLLVPDDDSMANAASSVTKIISNNQTMTRRNSRGFETWA